MSYAQKTKLGWSLDYEAEVPAHILERAEFMSTAWKVFPSTFLSHAESAAREFAALYDCESEYMAHNIAYAEMYALSRFKESQRNIESARLFCNFRRMAEREIRTRMYGFGSGGALVAVGLPSPNATRFVWIPATAWPFLKETEAEPNIVRGDGFSYWYVKVVELASLDPRKPKASEGPTQEEVNPWVLALYISAQKDGRPPPKAEEEVLDRAVKEIKATHRQVREAIKAVPANLKRQRGHKDRPNRAN